VDQEHPDNQESSRRRPLAWATVLTTVGVAVSALGMAGGLAARSSGPKQYGPGTPVNQVRFTVTVLGARIGLLQSDFSGAAKRSLIVKMRVVNDGKNSASVSVALATGLAGEPTPGNYKQVGAMTGLAADGSKTSSVEPGLPIEAEASWELAPGVSPAKVTIALRQWEYRPGFTDEQYSWWMSKLSTVIAEVTVPVARS